MQYKIADEKADLVRAYASHRIPFEISKKNQECRNFKKSLIAAIKRIESPHGNVFFAKYGTKEDKDRFFDTENVLFYNLGASPFRLLDGEGLCFLRMSAQEVSRLLPEGYSHYYEYGTKKRGDTKKFYQTLATMDGIELPRLKGMTPLDVWRSVLVQSDRVILSPRASANMATTLSGDAAFFLSLHIEAPKDVSLHAASLLKPLLDGAICAFHSGDFDDNVCADIARRLHCTEAQVRNESMGVLGKRAYLTPYARASLCYKWNPADDRLFGLSLSFSEGKDSTARLSGCLSPVCPHCESGCLAELLYGMPAYDEALEAALKSKRVALAGCMMPEVREEYRCMRCKQDFRFYQ